MLSKQKLFIKILQNIISWESSISTPGTSSWLRKVCLKAMKVKLEPPVFIGEETRFINPHQLTLGRNVAIGSSSLIACYAPIYIGNNFISAPGLYINSGSHDINSLKPSASPITIGKRVWCGMRVTICSGVTIGDDVVIGAGSVVTRSIPSGYLAVGVPAKPIKKIDRKETDHVWSLLCVKDSNKMPELNSGIASSSTSTK